MAYKDEVQKKNEGKLSLEFERDKTPIFIRKYLSGFESKASARNYYVSLKDFFNWLIENALIDEDSVTEMNYNSFNLVEAEDITMYLRQREQEGISSTTLETRKNIISSFFAYLVRSPRSDMSYNPVSAVKYRGIHTNNLFKKLPSEHEINAMFEKIRSKKDELVRERNTAMVTTLLGSGIRCSELAGLELADLFLEEDVPYITILGKGVYRAAEKRRVFITKSTVEALEKWLAIRNTVEGIESVEAVFVTKKGRAITEDTVKSLFKNYGGNITCHQLRHYYATVMAKKADVVFVAQNLGHKSLGTTVNNYANGFYGIGDLLSSM